MLFKILILLVCCVALSVGDKVQIVNGRFNWRGQQIFLSCANLAWRYYGYDFGDGQYSSTSGPLQEKIREIIANGGNCLRLMLHVEGTHTPRFDASGNVVSLDTTGTFISELNSFLTYAQQNNCFVILVLWHGAAVSQQNYINMINSDEIISSYVNVLQPLVAGVANSPALAAWEVVHEPEGSVAIAENANPCFDTTTIGAGGAGWTGVGIPMQRYLRFIGICNNAIRTADPTTLITASAWSELSQNNVFPGSFNHYTDSCLQQASGLANSHIDFFQMHTYAWEGNWGANAPFVTNANAYQLDKPLVIGKFAHACAQGETIQSLWEWAYNNNYAGIWSWQYNEEGYCSDTRAVQNIGLNHIRGFTHNGVIPVVI